VLAGGLYNFRDYIMDDSPVCPGALAQLYVIPVYKM
jgi:hypothetical protein